MEYSAIFTDFYSLTMAQGYWKRDPNEKAVFEMFFRHQPFNGGYSIFAGLGTLLKKLVNITFTDEDIDYIKYLGVFDNGFIEYLKTFTFTGTLWSADEGTVVFPNEPLIRIESTLIECQIIEGLLLNIINYQSLIATKTCRIFLASGKGNIIEFGLRRAQGLDGAVSASRASYIGGAYATSNTLAGKIYGIPVMGTMAHSWVMSFDSEEESFEKFAQLYPDRSIFLIDTYDTLKSGIHNAIKIGKKMALEGHNIGVRLDSGDINYISKEARRLLDEAGLEKALITVSNDLDENIIETLVKEGSPIDSWGVGTKMVTGARDAAFTGVYKISTRFKDGKPIPVMKFSDNQEKMTDPGIKQVWRIKDIKGNAVADIIGIDGVDELRTGESHVFWHPSTDYRRFNLTIEGKVEPLLKKRIDNGKLTAHQPSLAEIRTKVTEEIDKFDATYKRLLNPHIYKISITETLRNTKLELIQRHLGNK